jgi:hypothetical protein
MYINDDLDKYQSWTAGRLEGDEIRSFRKAVTMIQPFLRRIMPSSVNCRSRRLRCSGVIPIRPARSRYENGSVARSSTRCFVIFQWLNQLREQVFETRGSLGTIVVEGATPAARGAHVLAQQPPPTGSPPPEDHNK